MAALGRSSWSSSMLNAAEESDIVVRKIGDIVMRTLVSARVSATPDEMSSENLLLLPLPPPRPLLL